MVYIQILSPDGQRLWPNEGVYENPTFQSQGYSNIISDGRGGVIIGSRVGMYSEVGRTDSIYAQRIASNGKSIWGGGGLEIQMVRSALTVQLIAGGAVIIGILILIGVFRRNKIAKILTAVMPVFLGIAGLFCVVLMIGPFGYTYGWAYIPDTPVNKIAALMIPLASLAVCVAGISKKTVTRWVLMPVLVFCVIVGIITGLLLIFQK